MIYNSHPMIQEQLALLTHCNEQLTCYHFQRGIKDENKTTINIA